MRKPTPYLFFTLILLLIACGGRSEPRLYSVGGSVSGLNGTLTLLNNGADDLVITADGSFTFPTKLLDGSSYDVTVKQAPTTQNCDVSNGSGTVSGADVSNVLVSCAGKTWHLPASLADYLSVAGGDADDPQVALNAAGDAVVVWEQYDGGNLQIYKAELKGGSWSMPTDLTDHLSVAGTDAENPQVALNAAGDAVVVWQQKDGDSHSQIYKAELKSGSWSTPADLNDHLSIAGTNASNPQVALNAAGDAVVVWVQANPGNLQIYKAERRGGSWSVPADLTDALSVSGTTAFYPKVALNADGDAVVVWEQHDGSDWHVYKAELHGGNWRAPADLTDYLSVAGTGADNPQVALNAAGDAVVVWRQSDGSHWQIYKAERQEGSWSVPADLTDHLSVAGTGADKPQVALNAAGDAVVVWTQLGRILKAELHEGNWTTPADLNDQLSVVGSAAYEPQVALNAAGDVVVVWKHSDWSHWQIAKAERHNDSWTTPEGVDDHLSVAGTNADKPQVALSATGDAVVVWRQDNDAGFFQIYKAEYR